MSQNVNQTYSPRAVREDVSSSQNAPSGAEDGVDVSAFGEIGIQVGEFVGVSSASLKIYVWKAPASGDGFWSLAHTVADVYDSGEGWGNNYNGQPWGRICTRLTIDAGTAAVIISGA